MTELSETSDQGLLQTYAALTHRMHAARDAGCGAQELEARDQRNAVEAEILRRMA